MQISVVIPAYNEEKYIEHCLESLVDQKTSLSYEVIVVDNNSTDGTAKIARTFKDKLNLRIIHEEKQGRGAARARGFKEAMGEIILSADADTVYYRDWIDALEENLNDQTIAIISSCKITDGTVLTNAIFNFLQPKLTSLFRLTFGYYWLTGFSFAITKDVYIKSGGFNSHLQALEDVDLAVRVAKFGKIKFINKPVVFSGRRFKKGLLSGIFEYIKTFLFAYTLKREPVFMDNPR